MTMSQTLVISESSMTLMGITGLIWILLPIGACIFAAIKLKASPITILIGATVFFITQYMLRLPLLQFIFTIPQVQIGLMNPITYNSILSLTAGIFEECGRYIAFLWLLKNHRQWKDGMLYGLGHGGIEAILLVGLGNINNLIVSAAVSSGASSTLPANSLAQINAAAAALTSLTAYDFIAANAERLFTICLHIALTMLIIYSIRERKSIYLLVAILAHGFVNFSAVMLSNLPIGLLWSESFLLATAVLSILFIRKAHDTLLRYPV